MGTSAYTVVGMTCEHCVASVTEEVTEVPGVGDVDVELTTGGLTVSTADPTASVDDGAIRAAVAEAGYEIADRPDTGDAGGGS